MQNYAYDRVNTLAAHEAERQKLAAQMDEYVTSGGTIQIIEGFQYRPIPERTWNNNQGNRAAEDASRRRGVKNSAMKKRSGNTDKHREQRQRNIDSILPLLRQGLNSVQISERIGIDSRSVRRIITDEGLREKL
jgi:hypothetical protein